jgi:hypothetical protein
MSSFLMKLFRKLGSVNQKLEIKPTEFEFKDSVSEMFSFFSTPWKSKFEINGIPYGGKNDYDTLRISMLNLSGLSKTVNFVNKRILELGPLEGGNTIKLEALNPEEIISVEGRVESFIKCCLIKNIYGLNRTRFYLDNVMNISKEKYGSFDIAVILGLLYHLDRPDILLKRLSEMADVLIISTHYADSTSPYPNAEKKIIKSQNGEYAGRLYVEDPHSDPNAGLQFKSFWPYENDLKQMCIDSGFTNIEVLARNPEPDEQYKLIYFIAGKH